MADTNLQVKMLERSWMPKSLVLFWPKDLRLTNGIFVLSEMEPTGVSQSFKRKENVITRKDAADIMERVFDSCRVLRGEGQKEYAHSDQNALANFERVAADLKLDRKMVLWVYTRKHLDGIVSYINGHKSQREDVRGRIKDVIVYLCLLVAMIEEEDKAIPEPVSTNPLDSIQ